MIEVRCVGTNDNNLPFDSFKALFIEECNKEGRIIQLMNYNHNTLASVVVK